MSDIQNAVFRDFIKSKQGFLRIFASKYLDFKHLAMRRIFIFLFSLLPLSLVAQVGEPRSDWAIGVNGGMTLNKVLFTPNIRQQMFASPTFGITARYTSEKYFSLLCAIHLELNYARLGWKEDIYGADNIKLDDTYERHIDYLQLPLLASLGLGKEHNGFRGYIIAGPQLGYVLNDKEIRSSVWTTRIVDEVEVPNRANNVFAQYGKPIDKHLDYGIVLGLGTELSTKMGHFLFDVRYYYGLSDIFNNAKKDPFSRSANNTISCKVSYLIGVKKRSQR